MSVYKFAAKRQEDEEELQMKPLPTISSLQRQEDEEELQMQPLAQRQEDEEELQVQPLAQRQEEEEELQAEGDPMLAGGELSGDVESSVQSAKAGGQPLPSTLGAPLEQAFNADFSSVKLHTDSAADSLNRSLSARAFTTGQDIFFRSGEYNPGQKPGQELLAHELTHVVQQNPNTVQRAAVKPPVVKISTAAPTIIQRADWYEYGAANITPHIHAYSGGDCHLKDAHGTRFNLIQNGRRVKQARINEAYDAIRQQFPQATNPVRVAVLAKMSDLLRGVPKDKSDE